VPEGAKVLGVPRWIPTAVVRTKLQALFARARRNRAGYLLAEREHAYTRGLLAECWRQRREKTI
jgi:hypothetical protein